MYSGLNCCKDLEDSIEEDADELEILQAGRSTSNIVISLPSQQQE